VTRDDEPPTSGPAPDDPRALLLDLVHDLRTPLAVVLGFAELLVRHPGAMTDEQRDFAARIAEGAEQLRELVDDAAQAARSARSGGGAGK
jgi:signal transduction histidine kinase